MPKDPYRSGGGGLLCCTTRRNVGLVNWREFDLSVLFLCQQQELGVPHKRKARQMANCELVANWELASQNASINDLEMAIDWIGSLETDDSEVAQSMINAINFISKQIFAKQRKVAVNEAKREYAKENGVKFSQIKLTKKAVA
jgi:hypothetical protein